MQDLEDVRAEERQVDREEHAGHAIGDRLGPLPTLQHHHMQQNRRDDHRQGHGNAVRGRQRT